VANPDRDTVYTNDGTNRTVYTRESNSTGWFVGIIVALALLAIAYLVFSANSQPSTSSVDINNTPAVTTPTTPAAPADTTTTPMAPADTTTTPMAPADNGTAVTPQAPATTAPADNGTSAAAPSASDTAPAASSAAPASDLSAAPSSAAQ
jgi:cytoskeletal protein RodZ